MTHGSGSISGSVSEVSEVRRVAEVVLREHGVDIGGAERGRGWTNSTWLTDELVVRVANKSGATDLLREARLVRLLPAEIGCPPVIDSGVLRGREWVVTRRVAGRNLEEAWPSLDPASRARAIEQMWERARHIHRVDVAAAAPHARSRSPFFSDSPAEATARLERLVAAGELATSPARGLATVLDHFWGALPAAPKALNHGDFCTPNTLWHDGHVTALLDFEFAVLAPAAIDLNELIKIGFAPGDDDPDERAPLRDAVRRIAETELVTAGGADVLVGYSVMLEMWMLENQLAVEDSGGSSGDVESSEMDEADRANAIAMLMAFAEGDGGYFAPLLTDIP